MKKDNIYSIRKTKIGTFSAKIAVVTFLAIAGGEAIYQHNNITYAADVISEERTLESPIKYTADETKDVGYRELKTKGENGSLKLIEKDGNKIAERKEPTESEVVLGTKPQIERKIEKSKVEYVVDDTKDFGTREVVKEAKDGETTKITTFKVVTSPKFDLGKDVEKALYSNIYVYSNENLYSKDESKELPSDKIQINKLFVSVPKNQNITDKISARELVHSENTTLKLVDSQQNITILTPEMLDPENSALRKGALGKVTSIDGLRDYSLEKDEDFYNLLLTNSFNYLVEFNTTNHLSMINKDNKLEKENIRNYFAKNIITDGMYADVKANYLRFKLAISKLGKLNEYQEMLSKEGEVVFQSITRRFNSSKGTKEKLNIRYEGNIPDDIKKKFEEGIEKIPYEYRKNLVNLIVTDKDLPHADKLDKPQGLANGYNESIRLKYTKEHNQPITMLFVLLHEIGHIIDYSGGFNLPEVLAFGPSEEISPEIYLRREVQGFRNSKEYEDVYNKYFKNANPYPKYFTENKEEAFAEHLGRYIFKRVFGKDYPRYIIDTNSPENIKRIYPEDERYKDAFSPMDKAEYYFANLYNKLFEQPTEGKVEINTIKETHVDVQDGKVVLGTKPKEEIIRVAYDTEERIDSTLPKGMRKVLQSGVNGEILKISSYLLVNKETGELTTQVSERIIKNSIKEIILVGSKVENNEPKPKPIPGPGDKPKPDPKPGLGDKPKPNPEPAPGDGPIADPKPAPGDGPKPDPKPAPGDKPKPDPKPGLGDTPNPGDKAPGSSNNQSNLQSPRVNSNGLKTLPNTGESQTGVATVAGLVALAVAARLKRKDKQN
ncbi:G5 domain-containing protein [Gemella haemolysans]|uniref:LPXTG-motif cell wall anchor domain protein n=1 Tax=Gemella haemolysans ATCC 10379 TaxID=546270 RepID=C5NYX4_9BACL|nr:G5 domain-containing protein [Gemella haemolysans]EER67741.1 LPXTG-motif cell wall anchor domain protein [Gemella haemolysans ATCC 10379]KAA8709463.1 LPXTG cell wall anchor domain-containing protein [Gemella haemolysans]UBH83162.1 G5 domain-containing protein [Gemella haemolysans]VEI38560.1 Uncharacterized protein conserved in bacteria [Gemella haemolysans]